MILAEHFLLFIFLNLQWNLDFMNPLRTIIFLVYLLFFPTLLSTMNYTSSRKKKEEQYRWFAIEWHMIE